MKAITLGDLVKFAINCKGSLWDSELAVAHACKCGTMLIAMVERLRSNGANIQLDAAGFAEATSGSDEDAGQGLTRADYDSAILAQSACNLGALVSRLHLILQKMRAEVPYGTTKQAEHPIVRMYVEQLMHLSGGLNYEKAYNACFNKAKGKEE